MKALIIGAAGFVGGHLAQELTGSGWDVCGTKLPHEEASLDIPMFDLDILDVCAISDLLTRVNPDCVFHLAAQSSAAISWKEPALTIDVNIKGVVNLLEAVRNMENPPRVLLIGSGDEYGYVLPDEIPICEDTALRPGNIYASTKIAQGMLGQIYARAYGLEIIIVRAFNHIGPGQTDAFVIPAFCKQIAEIEAGIVEKTINVGNLEAKRDFTDVRDIVKAYRLLADKGKSGEIYNVGSAVATSIADVLSYLLKKAKVSIAVRQDESRMRPADTPVIVADISKLTSCTGWKPGITLETTLTEVLNQWRRGSGGSISFGTGGLRGIMGLGTGCINNNTIQRVTHGLAKMILASDAPKSVGVAFDTRHNSTEFAKLVCDVFSAFDIEVYTFDKPMPTPSLSYAIRRLSLGWGVVITASHNPQDYNGYKVYDCFGVQVTDGVAKEIMESIDTVGLFEPIPEKRQDLIRVFDKKVTEAYVEQVVSFVEPSDAAYTIVYSALHGSGASVVPLVLEKLGFFTHCIQQNPDGAFGGLLTPNPEEPVVYEEALDAAEKTGAKLILATDPDCDRVGVAAKTESGFELLSGNQIGALLIDYLVQTKGVNAGDTVISTIVSGLLGEQIAKENGLRFVRLLTGFKYIGEHIVHKLKDKNFFFGYEESYGYLAGDGARDKDAVIASALIARMAQYYDAKNMTLKDRLAELYGKYGYHMESLYSASVSVDGQKGAMKRLRERLSKDANIRSEDYITGAGELPPSDVLKIYYKGNANDNYTTAWAAVRPSGTEPKLKIYTGVRADTKEAAESSLKSLTEELLKSLDL